VEVWIAITGTLLVLTGAAETVVTLLFLFQLRKSDEKLLEFSGKFDAACNSMVDRCKSALTQMEELRRRELDRLLDGLKAHAERWEGTSREQTGSVRALAENFEDSRKTMEQYAEKLGRIAAYEKLTTKFAPVQIEVLESLRRAVEVLTIVAHGGRRPMPGSQVQTPSDEDAAMGEQEIKDRLAGIEADYQSGEFGE